MPSELEIFYCIVSNSRIEFEYIAKKDRSEFINLCIKSGLIEFDKRWVYANNAHRVHHTFYFDQTKYLTVFNVCHPFMYKNVDGHFHLCPGQKINITPSNKLELLVISPEKYGFVISE